jgi:Ca2+-binding EF-hand superfamily protein
LDADKNGKISANEISHILEEKEVGKATETKIKAIVRRCDKNGDGEIDYN